MTQTGKRRCEMQKMLWWRRQSDHTNLNDHQICRTTGFPICCWLDLVLSQYLHIIFRRGIEFEHKNSNNFHFWTTIFNKIRTIFVKFEKKNSRKWIGLILVPVGCRMIFDVQPFWIRLDQHVQRIVLRFPVNYFECQCDPRLTIIDLPLYPVYYQLQTV